MIKQAGMLLRNGDAIQGKTTPSPDGMGWDGMGFADLLLLLLLGTVRASFFGKSCWDSLLLVSSFLFLFLFLPFIFLMILLLLLLLLLLFSIKYINY